MKNNLSILISASLLLTGMTAIGQKNEFSLYAGAGMQGLQYDNNYGDVSIKPGFQAGVGYTRLFSPRWGIRTGLEIGYYHTRATLHANTAFTSNEVDSEGEGFEYRVKTNGYGEDQKVYTANIPLLLQFQTPARGRRQFYALGGAKLGIPFSQTYSTSAGEISASGYYPNLNIEITDLPVHGFGRQAGWSAEGDNDFKLSISLTAEAGLRFRVSTNSYLYAGAYIDYGLDNIKKTEGSSTLLSYDPNGLTQSKATGIFALNGATGQVRMIAYGIKVGFAFGSNPTPAKPAQPIVQQTPIIPPAVTKQPEQAHQPDTVKIVTVEKTVPEQKIKDTLTAADLEVLKTPVAFTQKGDTALAPASQLQVDKAIALMLAHPELVLEIQGHTCDVGTDAVNERIGLARAKAVAVYMESKGIATSRIHTTSKGDREPQAPNTAEANRQQNRRVVFIIIAS